MAQSKATKALTATKVADETDVPEWARQDGSESRALGEAGSSERPEGTQDPSGDESVVDGEVGDPQPQSSTPALDNLVAWLEQNVVDDSEDDLAGMESIMREVLLAEDMADVFRRRLPADAGSYLNVPFLLMGFTIRRSEFEAKKSLPYYVAMSVKMGDPEVERVITTSAMTVLGQIKRLSEIGTWPMIVKITEARAAKKGQSAPLRLDQVTD